MRKGGSYIIEAEGAEPERVAHTKPQPGPTRLLDADGRPLRLRPDEAIAERASRVDGRGPDLSPDGGPRLAGAGQPAKAGKTKAQKDGRK